MIRIYSCIVGQHDPRMIILAVGVCLLSSATAMGLLDRVGAAWGLRRAAWLAVTATVTGVGVWATHFIAVLGYRSSLPISYDPLGTAVSLWVAIIVLGCAIQAALDARLAQAAAIGGAMAGLGIGAMHYLGMAALWTEGRKLWDPGLMALSLALGAAFGALSFSTVLGGRSLKRKAAAAVLLTLAICSLHFVGMSAVSILPDPSVEIPRGTVGDASLAQWVATATLAVLLVSITALLVGSHQRRSEKRRLRELADAAVEGLAICDDGLIVTANESLARMVATPADQLTGTPFSALLEDSELAGGANLAAGAFVYARVRSAAGDTVPVELLAHGLSFDGKPRLAIAVRDLRDRVAAEAKMRFLAHHDGLTGLLNRVSFRERLGLELQLHRRKDDRFAVLCLDLDRFKQVNDLLGHAAGDLLLRAVSERIAAKLGPEDVFARLGGDEFAIVCLSLSRPADVARLCEDIIETVSQEVQLDDQAASVGASIGVALFPDDGDSVAQLERNADAALYQAKREGRGVYRFFEAGLGAKLRDRQALEFDLRRALARGEFSVVFQPQASTHTRAVFGFEALIRWTSPTRGPVAPSLFIPLAEETGLIVPIGEWVLREACAEAARWPKPLQVSVNVSAVQLRSPSLPRRVGEILQQVGLAPERVELEITETALVEDFEQALNTLRQLKALGVKVAMDDFGTGYSSLSNLRAFPFDKIKIDRSFVRQVQGNEHGATIVRAIVGLCQGLNLAVLAEGVETAEELRFLERENCPQAQGYLFGRPGPISDFPQAFAAEVLPLAEARRKG